MSSTLGALRQAVAQRAMQFAAGSADGGSTVSLVDAELQDSGASASLWEGSWLHIHAGANAGQTRRVTAYDPASGSLTVNRPFPLSVDTASRYDLLRLASPEQIQQAVNDTLARCWHGVMAPVTLMPDGDMEADGVDSWKAHGAAVSKAPAGQDSLAGAQALRVANTASDGRAVSQRLAALEGQRHLLEVWVAPGGGTAVLTVRNATAATTLATRSERGVQWRALRVPFSVPAGCHELEVWLGGQEAQAVTTWDNVILVQAGRRQYPLPGWIERRQQVVEVWERRADAPGGGLMRASEWWRLAENPAAAGSPFWLEVAAAPEPGAALVIEALRPYAPLRGEASATDAPADWIVQGALVEIYRRLKRDAPAADVARYDLLQREAAREFQQLSRLYQPRAVRRVMIAGGG